MRVLFVTTFVVALGALVSPSSAPAQSNVSFSCSASAVITQVAGASPLNPVTAGVDGQPCQAGTAGLPNTTEALQLNELVTAKTAYAVVDPGGSPPIKSKPVAASGVEDLQLKAGGGPVLGVRGANSSVTGSCAAGVPQFVTESEVASISLGGFPLVLDGAVQPITDALSDSLGALVSVRLNEVVDTPGGGKIVRAAHLKFLALDGSAAPLADIIIAESRMGLNGAACDASQPPNNGNPNDDDDPLNVCPAGSAYYPPGNVCVIASPGGQLTGPGSIIVGPPNSGPGGGTVVRIKEARKRWPKSPCVKGGGPRFVVVGTNGKDRLTGTNRRDRMIGLRGGDRLDGGRKRDCIDGGKGKDGMTGGQGRDRVHGRKGHDFLNGDSKSDRLYGGPGPDYINSGFGADRVFGGKGRDKMNVATAGKRAHVRGGKGFDKVRCNPGDLRGVHRDVERVIVTRKLRG
jgi:hypothetical protein